MGAILEEFNFTILRVPFFSAHLGTAICNDASVLYVGGELRSLLARLIVVFHNSAVLSKPDNHLRCI